MASPLDDPTASAPGRGDPATWIPPDITDLQAALSVAGRADQYHVLSRVGIGGMGAVYKATDLRLNRAVAIKTLHGPAGSPADTTARLRKEALAAASLDHPYICKVYELIETERGQLLVMEFVEGEPLSTVLGRGALPLPLTLRLGAEIAEGLAFAHERGLVHRDLKPANVVVTPHEHVKLLDFGLAQADPAGTSASETALWLQSADAYAGTPNYMAPEQADGRPATARADVFSLGVLLFKCVTGKLPFAGRDRRDYLAHLRADLPIPTRDLAPGGNDDLGRLIDACLQKAPANRPASAAVVQELRRISRDTTAPGDTSRADPAPRSTGPWMIAAAAGIALLAAGATFTWRGLAPTPSNNPLWRSRSFVTSSSDESRSRISPDKQWISYVSAVGGDTQLLVKRLDGGDAQRVSLPAGTVLDQVWSPDGNQLACLLRQDRTILLLVVPAFGGPPVLTVPVQPVPAVVSLLRWIDRTIYAQVSDSRGESLQRVDLDREPGRLVSISTAWPFDGIPRGFDVSPDGRVVYAVAAGGQDDLWVANLDGTSAKRLTNDASIKRAPIWSGRGATVLYQSNRGGQIDLWELALDAGRSSQLTSSQTVEEPESTSADGTLVSFNQVAEASNVFLWDVVKKTSQQLTSDALNDLSPTSTTTGSVVVYQRKRPTPLLADATDATMFVGSLHSDGFASAPRALADGFGARVSPDGSWLAYLQRGPGDGATLFVKELRTDRTITLSATCARPIYSLTSPHEWTNLNLAWSGSDLYFADQSDGWTIRRYRAGAPQAEGALATAPPGALIRGLRPSPDGRALAYLISSATTLALHVVDVSSHADRAVTSFQGTVYARGWLPDGDVVLVRAVGVQQDATAEIEVLAVSPAGTVRRIGQIDRALIATSRLDPGRGTLYVTRSEAGVHNLEAFSLTTTALVRVTNNVLPGVSFAGIEVLDGGRILGVRHERRSDIWLLDAAPQ